MKEAEERAIKRYELKMAREEGVKQGKEEGLEQGKLETAKKMKEQGIDWNIIAVCTDLSLKEIEEIK